jgi:hypothetical protein
MSWLYMEDDDGITHQYQVSQPKGPSQKLRRRFEKSVHATTEIQKKKVVEIAGHALDFQQREKKTQAKNLQKILRHPHQAKARKVIIGRFDGKMTSIYPVISILAGEFPYLHDGHFRKTQDGKLIYVLFNCREDALLGITKYANKSTSIFYAILAEYYDEIKDRHFDSTVTPSLKFSKGTFSTKSDTQPKYFKDADNDDDSSLDDRIGHDNPYEASKVIAGVVAKQQILNEFPTITEAYGERSNLRW